MEINKIFNGLPIRTVESPEGLFFYASDIGDILGIREIKHSLRGFSESEIVSTEQRSKYKIITYKKYKNSFRLSDRVILLTELGLKRVVCNSRSSKANELAKFLGIDILTRIEPIETETIRKILTVFENEKHILQFRVPQTEYYIDLYFPDYNLAVECDENHHKQHIGEDIERENMIKNQLACKFIRYEPQAESFDIFKTIGQIYNHISGFCMR